MDAQGKSLASKYTEENLPISKSAHAYTQGSATSAMETGGGGALTVLNNGKTGSHH